MVEKTIIEKLVNLNENIEVLIEDGNKRLVKRFSFSKGKNNKPQIDYCFQTKKKFDGGLERWCIEYFNRSKTLVERRFLGLK